MSAAPAGRAAHPTRRGRGSAAGACRRRGKMPNANARGPRGERTEPEFPRRRRMCSLALAQRDRMPLSGAAGRARGSARGYVALGRRVRGFSGEGGGVGGGGAIGDLQVPQRTTSVRREQLPSTHACVSIIAKRKASQFRTQGSSIFYSPAVEVTKSAVRCRLKTPWLTNSATPAAAMEFPDYYEVTCSCPAL